MTNTDSYYAILGIERNAGLDDIKKAYRTKAKILHPDKNKNADAQEQFVLLNEAYEYLQNVRTGKLYDPKKTTARTQTRTQPQGRRTYDDWQNTDRDKARERAKAYAKMKYDEFTKTDEYKKIVALDTVASYIGFFMAIAVCFILPLLATIFYGVQGFGGSILIIFISMPMTVIGFRNAPPMQADSFFVPLLQVVKTTTFRIVVLSILNILIILKIDFQTLVPTTVFTLVFAFTITLGFFISKVFMKKEIRPSLVMGLCYFPFVLNILFVINFLFASHPVTETYRFTNQQVTYSPTYSGYRYSGGGKQSTSLIYLENEKYDDMVGLRCFADYEAMSYSTKITYTFKNGLLGFRVMTDYKFSN